MQPVTITAAYKFLDSWNSILEFQTPVHHKQIMQFLIDVLNNAPHRGLLNAFRHSGKSTVVGIFAACVLYHRPETRILILSAESNLASRMVAHIRNILENHPFCVDILPDAKKEWGTHKITIKRPIGIRDTALNTTERWLTKSKYRFFLPYGTKVFCIWHMACQVLCTQKSYIRFCLENGLTSPSGNIKTSAEAVYAYMTDNAEFSESHTGLRDVLIEVQIMARCFRQHKHMDKAINRSCWRIPQVQAKEIAKEIGA